MANAIPTPLALFATVLKDLVAALRDGTLFALFVALLAAPTWIRDRLVEAGFKKGSIGGFEWEASLERTKETALRVSAAKADNADLAEKIGAIAARSQDPEVKSLVREAEAARVQILKAEAVVKRDLSAQQAIVKSMAPESPPLTGWLYLGAVDEAKTSWRAGAPVSIHPVDAKLARGQILALREDRYLHAEAENGNRAQAPVAGLVQSGDEVEVLEVDYSHARAGGWFVWVRARAVK